METPIDQSPVLDATGKYCHIGQSGSVWFLAGTLDGTTANRTCTVPAGKALFFPILNSATFRFCTDPELSEDCILNNYECLREDIRLPDDVVVSCEIDGKPVTKLKAYYVESPAFAINTTLGSVGAAFGFPEESEECPNNGPAVDNAVYLMVNPLPPGMQTIHFKGESDEAELFSEVNYSLIVTRNADFDSEPNN